MSKELVSRLSTIQKELKAPKGQMNKFGGYAYRSCEDILEAVKPHLDGLILTVSDSIQIVGEGSDARIYVTATAAITDGTDTVSTTASAREPKDQKGMNAAQITGSASSYARKYALNGLLLIDDTKDADATNDHGKKPAKETKSPVKKKDDKKSSTSFRQSVKKDEPKKTAPEQVEEEEL